jgi:4'-phosphopantetheinyl transferase EntD
VYPSLKFSPLLPAAGVGLAEAYADRSEAYLFPEEELLVASAIPRRRLEFATGRDCARQALAHLGVEACPIGRGTLGAPQWPAGIVGSITHCSGFRAAAAARRDVIGGIGIDAEPHQMLAGEVIREVASPAEVDMLTRLNTQCPSIAWSRLLFSAKESVYKVWAPIMQSLLGFDLLQVRFHPSPADCGAGTFCATLLEAPLVYMSVERPVLVGSYRIDSRFILSAVVLPVPSSPPACVICAAAGPEVAQP